MNNNSFENYDRISDTLLYLSNDITLGFVTSLSRKDKNGNRAFFHSEYKYSTTKYNSSEDVISIKRQMIYYFVVENKQNFIDSLILRPQDIAVLIMLIEQSILPWYFGNKRIYVEKENKLIIKGEYEAKAYVQSEYKYLSFSPIVYSFEDNTFKEGIRVTLNHSDTYADITIDKFMGFYYIIKNTDMYSIACSMAEYAKTQPYNINMYNPVGLGGGFNSDKSDAWKNDDLYEKEQSKNGKNRFFDNL